jgi:hypothetical protein
MSLSCTIEKLYTRKAKLDNGVYVKAWWRRAPSISNPNGKILAGIEVDMEPGLTISNGGYGRDLIRADFTIDKFVSEPQHIWDNYVAATLCKAKVKLPEPEIIDEIDVDYAAKLTAHDWFYTFSDSANVYKRGKAEERALVKEASGSKLKNKMLQLVEEWRNDTISANAPTKPIWL